MLGIPVCWGKHRDECEGQHRACRPLKRRVPSSPVNMNTWQRPCLRARWNERRRTQPCAAATGLELGLPAVAGPFVGRCLPLILANVQTWLPHRQPIALMRGLPRAVARLQQLAPAAARAIWWPFTQHAALDALPGAVSTVDARCGEHLVTLRHGAGSGAAGAPLCSEISPGALPSALLVPRDVQPGRVAPAPRSLQPALSGCSCGHQVMAWVAAAGPAARRRWMRCTTAARAGGRRRAPRPQGLSVTHSPTGSQCHAPAHRVSVSRTRPQGPNVTHTPQCAGNCMCLQQALAPGMY
jgi:hypothetical protein